MKKIILSAALLLSLFSCKDKTEKDIIRESFMEYVRTDFDNPNDFIKITKIEMEDSIDLSSIVEETNNSIEEAKDMFSKELMDEFYEYKKDFEAHKSDFIFITYNIKVRERKNDKKVLNEYKAMKKSNGYIISDRDFSKRDFPDIYKKSEIIREKVELELKARR